jgi:hypothetical protein
MSWHSPPRPAHVVAFDALSVATIAFVVGVVVFGDLYRSIGLLKQTNRSIGLSFAEFDHLYLICDCLICFYIILFVIVKMSWYAAIHFFCY